MFAGLAIWIALLPVLTDDPEPGLLPISCSVGIPIAALFIVMAIGGLRQKLVLSADSAYVRNVFYSRTIPRSEVTGYTFGLTLYLRQYPAIQWQRNGKRHKTVINFLSPAGFDAPIELGQTGVANMTATLRAWCEASR